MRVRHFLGVVVLVLAFVGMAVPASADSSSATLKYEGSETYQTFWYMGSDVYIPTTPYISNTGTPLVSKIYITVHDLSNYSYWVRFGWCYANPAYGTNCSADYNPSGAGDWVPFIELNNQDGNTLGSSPAYATPGGMSFTMSIAYSSGAQYTNFYLNNINIYNSWTKFSANGFMPVDAGGYTSISNANPAYGDAVWMGGLGKNNAAQVSNTVICESPGGFPSQDCEDIYWTTTSPSSTKKMPPSCGETPCPYGYTATTPNSRYIFFFWTYSY